MIETRGLPSGAWSSASMSSGSPWSHVSNPGAASRLFSRIARAKRSLAGKERLELDHPDAAERRVLDQPRSAQRARGRVPAFQALARMLEIRMCSRLCIGSASIPSSPRRLVAVVPTRSLSASASSRIACGRGGERLEDRDRQPGLAARGVDAELPALRGAARCGLRPGPSRQDPSSRARPAASANSADGEPLLAGLARVDPRGEVFAAQLGEGQQQVGQVAFRVHRWIGTPYRPWL